jgi:hypothetical protein
LIAHVVQRCILDQHIQKSFDRRNIGVIIAFVPELDKNILGYIFRRGFIFYIPESHIAKRGIILFEKYLEGSPVVLP